MSADCGIYVEESAITNGPKVNWKHIDGPLMTWAGQLHWLTWRERVAIWLGLKTVRNIASKRWPHLERLCCEIIIRQIASSGQNLADANSKNGQTP